MKKVFSLLTFVFLVFTVRASFTVIPGVIRNVTSEFILEYLDMQYPETDFTDFIYVRIKKQKLLHFKDGKLFKVYDVSTGRNGVGCEAGSGKTPTGLHYVKGKYGTSVPFGGILKSKRFTGHFADIINEPISSNSDDITTRVLTLSGKEEGHNKGGTCDSYQRRIYIHGTPEEGLIGQPVSHGCVRMRNSDVIELFDNVDVKTPVILLNN